MVVDSTVLCQANLTGATRGNTFAALLHRILERSQRMSVQLRGGETFVASKPTTVNALGNNHVFAALARQIDQRLALAQVLGAARDVHGDRRFLWREVEAVHQVGADETHRIVQVQTHIAQILNQPQGAGAGVAIDGIEPASTGVQQRADQFLAFVLGLLCVAFGREGLATAEGVWLSGKTTW